MADTNTVLQSNYPSLKNEYIFKKESVLAQCTRDCKERKLKRRLYMERLSINVRLEFWVPSQFLILRRPSFLLIQLLPPGCSNEEMSREGCVLFLTLTHSHTLPPRIHPPIHCFLLFLNWVNSFKHLPIHPPIHAFTHNTYLSTH